MITTEAWRLARAVHGWPFGMVEDADIELVLITASSVKSACPSLVHLALRNGGRDNLS
ncbi:MAG TPA: hypothetical protein VF074_18865 [Pyrinomonadaceae bacterium]